MVSWLEEVEVCVVWCGVCVTAEILLPHFQHGFQWDSHSPSVEGMQFWVWRLGFVDSQSKSQSKSQLTGTGNRFHSNSEEMAGAKRSQMSHHQTPCWWDAPMAKGVLGSSHRRVRHAGGTKTFPHKFKCVRDSGSTWMFCPKCYI